MAQRRQNQQNKRQMAHLPPENRGLRYPPVVTERSQPKTYGKPLIVLEDQQKNTFVYSAGNWVPHAESIAQCRELGQVKELPQRLNGRVRYEVRYAD